MRKDNTNKTGRQWQVDVHGEHMIQRYHSIEEPKICGRSQSYVKLVLDVDIKGVNGTQVMCIPLGQHLVRWHEMVTKQPTLTDVAMDPAKKALEEEYRRQRNEARQRGIDGHMEVIKNANEKIEALRRSME